MSRNGKPKYSREEILEAIAGSFGIKNTVCKKLGCSRHTLNGYIEKYQYVKDAMDAEKEEADDFVESKLMRMIKAGDVAATIFYAKTRMRGRGYGEHVQLEPVKPAEPPRLINDIPKKELPTAGKVIEAEVVKED